jgi:hypothetical protein
MTGKFVKGAWVEDEVQSNLGDFSCSFDTNAKPVKCGDITSIKYSLDVGKDESNIYRTPTGDPEVYAEYRNKLGKLSEKYGGEDNSHYHIKMSPGEYNQYVTGKLSFNADEFLTGALYGCDYVITNDSITFTARSKEVLNKVVDIAKKLLKLN